MLGSGNVATHLSLAFEAAGQRVQTIYSQTKAHADALAAKLKNAGATSSLDFTVFSAAAIYFVCVKDAAVEKVVQQARFPENSLVVHTSGTLPITVLDNIATVRRGVFYPIQTFSKNTPVNITATPIAIESADPEGEELLKNLAAGISRRVVRMSGDDRKKIHLAAVFACNFTNHLLGISQEILSQNNLETSLLENLIQTTVQKAFTNHPFAVQTGPAVRKDENIIREHLQQLQATPTYQDIYRLITSSIQQKALLA